MQFLFKTSTYMKSYNCKNWFITSNIIGEKRIKANNLKTAINNYANELREHDFTEISKNAIKNKNKNPIFRDDKNGNPYQVGYVITASQIFRDEYGKSSKQYIDLWIEIISIVDIKF